MLKKFLKFLRGDGEESENLEQSYLNDLLRRVQPRLVEQLDACPEHDPLPLLVAEILREVDERRFQGEVECPVADAQSPPLDPDAVEETTLEGSSEPPPAPEPPPPPDSEAELEDPEDELERESTSNERESGGEVGGAASADEIGEEEPGDEAASGDEDSHETGDDADGENDAGGASAEAESAEESSSEEETDQEEPEEEESEENESAREESAADGSDEPAGGDESDEQSDAEATGGEQGEDSDEGAGDDDSDDDSEVSPEQQEGAESVEVESDSSDDDGASNDESVESDDVRDPDPEIVDAGEVEAEDDPEGPADDTNEFFASGEEDTDPYGGEAATVDAPPNRVPEEADLVGDEATDPGPPAVDSNIVLEMGRVFLGMLVENDALPVELQMSAEEIDEARKLLAGYFLGDELVDERARDMLRMVENKFDEGLFSQARILLQLFDADKQTRIENDRNLFFEEMILRFGIQRRHPVGDDIEDRFEERLDQYGGSADDLEELLVWLSQSIYVTFDLYGRSQSQLETWEEIASLTERPRGAERLLDVIPPERWRLLDEYARPASEILDERFTAEYVEAYVTEHVKTCYFVLRAVGDTGLEPYLDVFFDWIDEDFGVDGPRLMPGLYTETTANERLIDDIFHDLYVDHFEGEVESIRQEWDGEEIEDAIDEVVDHVGATDLSEIPPGHYDLGRFVLDKLFEVEYPSDDFPFKMHRIT